jgi:hypothetical protein
MFEGRSLTDHAYYGCIHTRPVGLRRPLFFFSALPAVAAINAYGLGASYDSTQSNVIFRVYSSRAPRIDVYLYASPLNSPEVLSFPLSASSGTNTFFYLDTGRDAAGSRDQRAGVLRLSCVGAELAFFEQLDQA